MVTLRLLLTGSTHFCRAKKNSTSVRKWMYTTSTRSVNGWRPVTSITKFMARNGVPRSARDLLHNFEDRSARHIIPHNELFLGHFPAVDRHIREVTVLDKEAALGNFEERLHALSDKETIEEAKRCMSCGQCFECDNCIVYCPQTCRVQGQKERQPHRGSLRRYRLWQVHRLSHLCRRVPDRLYRDGDG